jgi:hypothetical protein
VLRAGETEGQISFLKEAQNERSYHFPDTASVRMAFQL